MFSGILKKLRLNIRRNKDIKKYTQLLKDNEFVIDKKKLFTIYEDEECAGVLDFQYFLQDLYFAKKIIENKTKNHFDIGSRIDGFIAHLLSSDVNVTQIDIRPFPIEIDGLSFIQADATNLDNIPDESISSLSSLHAIEHFGLGRYGDPINPDSWKLVLNAIQKKICRGGLFYLGLPISNKSQVYFNAHRVFNPKLIIDELDSMKLLSFSYIHDEKIIKVEDFSGVYSEFSNYDCGLFIFRKV